MAVEFSKVSAIERKICQEIRAVDQDLRNKYPLLQYQDAIGFGFFVLTVCTVVSCWFYYIWKCPDLPRTSVIVAIIAVAISIMHELEHDLIHNIYFKNSPSVQNAMFLIIWFAKLHGNPWFRKDLHLKHHMISGQVDDAEERLIGLGLPMGWRRLVITAHPIGMPIVTEEIEKDCSWFRAAKMNLTSLPTAVIFFGLFKALTAFIIFQFLFPSLVTEPVQFLGLWLWKLNIMFIFPNILRQSCLHFMSNATHYYGDIPDKSVYFQNQILDHPIVLPFQLFCCNFGATHIIHHYVPGQPFYIRELVYRKVKSFMVEQGVRNNDLGILLRGNRYFSQAQNGSDSIKNISSEKALVPPLETTWLSSSFWKLFPDNPSYSFYFWCAAIPFLGYTSLLLSDSMVSYSVVTGIIHRIERRKLRNAKKNL